MVDFLVASSSEGDANAVGFSANLCTIIVIRSFRFAYGSLIKTSFNTWKFSHLIIIIIIKEVV